MNRDGSRYVIVYLIDITSERTSFAGSDLKLSHGSSTWWTLSRSVVLHDSSSGWYWPSLLCRCDAALVGEAEHVCDGTAEAGMQRDLPRGGVHVCHLVAVCSHRPHSRGIQFWTAPLAVLDKTRRCRHRIHRYPHSFHSKDNSFTLKLKPIQPWLTRSLFRLSINPTT